MKNRTLNVSMQNLLANVKFIESELIEELDSTNENIKNVSFLQFDRTRDAIKNFIEHIEYTAGIK